MKVKELKRLITGTKIYINTFEGVTLYDNADQIDQETLQKEVEYITVSGNGLLVIGIYEF